MKTLLPKTAFTASLLALLPTAAATIYPLTLTDDLGRKVTLKAEPGRIISMVPGHSETLCAVGACGKLVGVDRYSDYPQQVARLPKVGDLFAPDVEAMVALRPDLVLVSQYSKLEGPLTQAGIPVFALDMEKYDEVFSKTLTLGRVVNREAQARALTLNMRREIARVEILTKNAVRKPTTYLEIDPTPYSVGPNSFMGVLLGKAGARNIVPAALGDFPKVDPELIVKANPQLMLGLDRRAAAARPGWAGLQAVRTGRVLDIPKDLNTILSRPGPRMPQALRGLARLVHPELFK
ncbi:ABC transporter substrate-binding protein [Deinococcus budaensis]|uniref:Iron complex transport system substrate-binding protein n=1 Tax=Deinococcus budaensis TaxID=1665626 RepID=A0A7W8GIG5_9DEIO|nr:ABC transporter substrate-binding protein [Deinococcus budaensis]MBB5236083.1 iron complex transport system substrate-binding protein [Deinococcus budaensis]